MMRRSGSSRGPGGGFRASLAPLTSDIVPARADGALAARAGAADSARSRGPRGVRPRIRAPEPPGTARPVPAVGRFGHADPRRAAGRRGLHGPLPGLRLGLRLAGKTAGPADEGGGALL